MGELYNPYPKLPKNIRQIGERDPVVKLYIEDYVNTYLKRLSPAGGRDLRVGLLLGEMRMEEGVPYIFVEGAMEMELETSGSERVFFTEDAWKQAWKTMEQSFPKRTVLGWFLCGAQGSMLSPLNYWREHGQYFSARYQLMYLNSSLDGEEAVYVAAEDGFYHLRGYCVYYERNQMMQDYMVSRKDARRVESGARDEVIRDFRQKMADRRAAARRQTAVSGILGTVCGVLSVAVLAGGVVMFNNYHKMKEMEAVIASVMPAGNSRRTEILSDIFSGGRETVEIEEVAGEVYPTPGSAVETVASGEDMLAKESMQEMPEQTGEGGNMTASRGETAGRAASETDPEPEIRIEAEPVQIPADAVAYVVQDGETLYGICLDRYQSISRLPEICLWNGLEDENKITSGQTLMLPPVG